MTSGEPPSGASERPFDVIVVEDDPDARAMAGALFAMRGWIVRAFETVEAAHAAAMERAPDVVVTDLHLGDEHGGWRLACVLRDHPATRHVGLIAVTGRVAPRPEIVRAFDAYLSKPVETGVLLELVSHLGASTRASRSRARSTG